MMPVYLECNSLNTQLFQEHLYGAFGNCVEAQKCKKRWDRLLACKGAPAILKQKIDTEGVI